MGHCAGRRGLCNNLGKANKIALDMIYAADRLSAIVPPVDNDMSGSLRFWGEKVFKTNMAPGLYVQSSEISLSLALADASLEIKVLLHELDRQARLDLSEGSVPILPHHTRRLRVASQRNQCSLAG